MSDQTVERVASAAAEAVMDRFAGKFTQSANNKLRDDELARKNLFHQRRNLLIALVENAVQYEIALTELAEAQLAKEKDKEWIDKLQKQIDKLALIDKAHRSSLEAVTKITQSDFISEVISKHYGDVQPAAWVECEGEA